MQTKLKETYLNKRPIISESFVSTTSNNQNSVLSNDKNKNNKKNNKSNIALVETKVINLNDPKVLNSPFCKYFK